MSRIDDRDLHDEIASDRIARRHASSAEIQIERHSFCEPSDRVRIATPEPLTELREDERAVAREISAELERITALVGVGTDTCPPPRSIAAGVRTRLGRLGETTRGRVVAIHARTDDSQSVAQAVAIDDDGVFEIAPRVRHGLRQAFARRLEELRPQLRREATRALRRAATRDRDISVPKTRVDIRLAGEVDSTWRTQINMSSPEMLDCRWSSAEPEARRGWWELRGPVGPGHSGSVVAGGPLPDTPGEPGVGGYFSIPLSHHLAPTPPVEAATYHLRVLPLDDERMQAALATPSRVFGPVSPATGPTAPDGVGQWSAPAIIRYGTDFSTPPTDFSGIRNVTAWRKAHFFVDWFQLVADQTGAGDEEFHLSGFLVEINPTGSFTRGLIGPSSFTVAEDDRSQHPFGRIATIDVGLPSDPRWPRTFMAFLSLMEEDDGESLDSWRASLTDLLHEALHGEIAVELGAFLREMKAEIEAAREELAGELAAETAGLIVAIIASNTREMVSAWIALMIAWIVGFIRAGSSDDFYGTQIMTLILRTNVLEEIVLGETGQAGHVLNTRVPASGGVFEGNVQPDGSWRMRTTEMQFLGLGGPEEGSSVSGIANIAVHWELSDRVHLSIPI